MLDSRISVQLRTLTLGRRVVNTCLASNVPLLLSTQERCFSAISVIIRYKLFLFSNTGSAERLNFQGIGSNFPFCFSAAKPMEVVGVLIGTKCVICK